LPEADPGRAGKILDEDLRQLAATGEAKPVSVIVEPDLPRPRVEMDSEGSHGPSPIRGRPRRVVPPEDGESEEIVEEVRKVLEKASVTPPVWNSLSKVFTLDIATDQLDTVAHAPNIRRISRNRTLRTLW
jgi:hypothetical protein